MLPLTFADPADYEKIKPDDKVRSLYTNMWRDPFANDSL